MTRMSVYKLARMLGIAQISKLLPQAGAGHRIGLKGVRRSRSCYNPHHGKNVVYITDATGNIRRSRVNL